MSDYETTADLNEQIHYERLDADMEQAALEGQARASAARAARGICDHNSQLGGGVNVYSAQDIQNMFKQARFGNRGGFTGSQADIGKGKALCTDCGELINDRFADR